MLTNRILSDAATERKIGRRKLLAAMIGARIARTAPAAVVASAMLKAIGPRAAGLVLQAPHKAVAAELLAAELLAAIGGGR